MLNRNENIIPAVAKLKRDQAAAYFMLGETKGTSAGGAARQGKSLRVPGTNPFFFDNDALHGEPVPRAAGTMPDVEVYLMNTGRVGGVDEDRSLEEGEDPHRAAVVQGIVEGSIDWEEDPDFGYSIAAELPGFPDDELLRPREMYASQDRIDEYDAVVQTLKADRREYIRTFPGLDPSIIDALG